jgi:hypothetical protein
MLPLVAEIKHVRELLVQVELAQLHPLVVQQAFRLVVLSTWDAEARAVGAGELVEVTAIPAGARGGEEPAGPGPEHLAVAGDQVHADG